MEPSLKTIIPRKNFTDVQHIRQLLCREANAAIHPGISHTTRIRKLETLAEQHRQDQLKLTTTALEAQEKERNAIGQELHDNVNQILVGTKLFLSMVKNDPVKNKRLISTCIDNLQNAIDENRKIAHGLVTPQFETSNLAEQIFTLTKNMLKTSGMDVEINTAYLREELLDEQQKLAVYRIAQEQCTNIVKYAKASLINVALSTVDGVFKMIIADNGVGMKTDEKTNGIGLINVKGRLSILKGRASIDTAPGKGFTLQVTIPLGIKNASKALYTQELLGMRSCG